MRPDLVRAQLGKILASKVFSHAERQSRLLRFTVEETLEGRGGRLKEYLLGLEVLDKDESFDPRIDPAVRVEVHRLRARLKQYYESEGRDDAVRIEFSRGHYAPLFREAARPRRRWILAVAGIAAMAAVAAALYWGIREWPRAPAKAASILVLPFEDVSPQHDQEYFCDGITEELIQALAKVEGLRVASRVLASQYRGKAIDVRKVGEQLNAGVVLEGSVRKEGDKVRVTARLVSVADGYHLWSATHEREMKQVFALQEEIARAIVNALRVRLVGGDSTQLVRRHTGNLDAYNAYLKGRYYWSKRTEDGLRRSVEHFEQAIRLEPGYAAAHAGLADSHAMLASYGVVSPREAMPKAKEAAVRALSLDDTLPDAHASIGFISSFYEWDWRAAEREYKRAIELDPGYPTAHQWYSGCLRAVGRLEEALAEMKLAQDLDPLSRATGRDLGRIYRSMRQYDKAIEEYRKVLDLEPGFPSVWLHLGMAYEDKGMYKEALEALEKARSLPGGNPLTLGALGHGYAAAGDRRRAGELLVELDDLSRRRYVSPTSKVLIYLGLGDKSRALQWLERAFEEHDPWLAWMKTDPVFDPLRTDPRFISLLRKVGLGGS